MWAVLPLIVCGHLGPISLPIVGPHLWADTQHAIPGRDMQGPCGQSTPQNAQLAIPISLILSVTPGGPAVPSDGAQAFQRGAVGVPALEGPPASALWRGPGTSTHRDSEFCGAGPILPGSPAPQERQRGFWGPSHSQHPSSSPHDPGNKP